MDVSNVEVKQLIFDVITYQDGFNVDNSRTFVTNIPAGFFQKRLDVVTKLSFSAEMAFFPKDIFEKNGKDYKVQDSDIAWHKVSDIKNGKVFKDEAEKTKYVPCGNRFTDEKLIFTKDDLDIIRYFYFKRDDLTGFSEAARSELINGMK